MVTELGNLNAMGVIGTSRARAKWRHSTTKGKVVMIAIMVSRDRKQQSEQSDSCRPVVLAS